MVLFMAEEFELGPDLVSVTDDDGNEYTFEVIDRIETDEGRYVALLEYYEDPDDFLESDGEVIVLKVLEEDGESYLIQIEDEEEFDEISSLFEERLSNLYDDDEETEDTDSPEKE